MVQLTCRTSGRTRPPTSPSGATARGESRPAGGSPSGRGLPSTAGRSRPRREAASDLPSSSRLVRTPYDGAGEGNPTVVR